MDVEDFKVCQRKLYPLSDNAPELLLQEGEEVRFRKGVKVWMEGGRTNGRRVFC